MIIEYSLGKVRSITGNSLAGGEFLLYQRQGEEVYCINFEISNLKHLAERFSRIATENSRKVELTYLSSEETRIISCNVGKKTTRFLKVSGLEKEEKQKFESFLGEYSDISEPDTA